MYKRVDESEEPGYFWKLEQISQGPKFFMPQDSRITSGRITKVFINEDSCTKVTTTWRDAWSALDELYGRMYFSHDPDTLDASSHCRIIKPAEMEDLVAIAFVLRYSEEELQDAPLRLNINIRGNELPGAWEWPAGMVINVRTGKKVLNDHGYVHNIGVKFIGGLAVLTKNPTGIKMHAVDKRFIKHLLQKFGQGRLHMMSLNNKYLAWDFCERFGVKEPFGRSWCMIS